MHNMNPTTTAGSPSSCTHKASENPVAFADRRGQEVLTDHDQAHRKKHGQYFTALRVARFLAELTGTRTGTVRILDPGAGSGTLACAVAEHLANETGCRNLVLDAYERDPLLVPVLSESMDHLARWLAERGVGFEYRVLGEDFILSTANQLHRPGIYDLVVSNPPYFKVGATHPVASIPALTGSSNIYAAFMLAASRLLAEGGRMVFITPRSYASGAYFREFRRRFFKVIRPDRLHLFGSRKQAFSRDEIIQECLVLSAIKESGWQAGAGDHSSVRVSQSGGACDLDGAEVRSVPLDLVLDLQHPELFLRLPCDDEDERVLRTVDAWPCSLHAMGLEVSTGRVVPFRATQYLREHQREHAAVPLLWLQHVHAMRVTWPIGFHKPEYIDDRPETQRLLVSDSNYVLLRRFSSKEQNRRLTAAPLYRGTLGACSVGIENHVNYVWAKSEGLSADLARGLALLFNSRLLDQWFRILNGNTEVSATEIRSLPLPDRASIEKLGRRFDDSVDLAEMDRWLEELPGSE